MAMTTIDYEVNDRWEQAPEGITHKDVSAVGVDSLREGPEPRVADELAPTAVLAARRVANVALESEPPPSMAPLVEKSPVSLNIFTDPPSADEGRESETGLELSI